ncbi:hypothetical protein WA1_38850 [Scytonema hofmannii PCC 7110]|uniref:DUF1778 domain-containing protein n=1 Tax=Scytonema hofmannii PCC 7110 TaxID=128403 RepID=A0A139X0S3_9CYAN|nr:DUF1778 domain-containing protein [Scytonema hofmannii]KYC38294.1 hypothetical protein WA1_38850 [Scytonema hofmannii PCC 7110]
MSTSSEVKTTQIEITLNEEQKQTLEKAAAMRCLTLSEYLVELAINAATEEIPEPESMVLSEQDWEIFVSAIENPPELNPRLKAAIQKYKNESEKK